MAYGCIWSKKTFSWLWWEGHWRLVSEPLLGGFPREKRPSKSLLQGVSSNLPLTMCDANISCIYKRVVSPEMWNTYNPENKYSLRIEPPNGSFHHMIPKVQNLLFQGDMFRFYLCAFRAREISFLPGYIQIALVVTTGTYCMKFSQGPISTHSWTKSWKQVHHVEKKSDLYNHYQKSPSVKAAHNFHRNWVSLPQNDPQCSPKASFAIFVATSLTNKQQKILPSFCRQNFLHWGRGVLHNLHTLPACNSRPRHLIFKNISSKVPAIVGGWGG